MRKQGQADLNSSRIRRACVAWAGHHPVWVSVKHRTQTPHAVLLQRRLLADRLKEKKRPNRKHNMSTTYRHSNQASSRTIPNKATTAHTHTCACKTNEVMTYRLEASSISLAGRLGLRPPRRLHLRGPLHKLQPKRSAMTAIARAVTSSKLAALFPSPR